MKGAADTSSTAHLALFKGMFADGLVQAERLSNQGSDVTILPRKLFYDGSKVQTM